MPLEGGSDKTESLEEESEEEESLRSGDERSTSEYNNEPSSNGPINESASFHTLFLLDLFNYMEQIFNW